MLSHATVTDHSTMVWLFSVVRTFCHAVTISYSQNFWLWLDCFSLMKLSTSDATNVGLNVTARAAIWLFLKNHFCFNSMKNLPEVSHFTIKSQLRLMECYVHLFTPVFCSKSGEKPILTLYIDFSNYTQ